MKRVSGKLKIIVGKVLMDESTVQLLFRLEADGSVDIMTLRREGIRKPDTSTLEVLELVTVEVVGNTTILKSTDKLKPVLDCWCQFLTDMAATL
jgi:hypothetical protein